MNLSISKMLAGAAVVALLGAASAANAVTISNAPSGGAIAPFGTPDTETYGEVFTAPVTGTMTSFTLWLNGGVGNLYGGVDGWNGTAAFGFGFGSTGNLFTSGAVNSPGAGAYTFSPNIAVVAGQQYVAYLSVFGDGLASGTTTMPLGTAASGLDYFVWNNTSAPQGNGSWNYFFDAGNAQFSASFAVPEPATWALMLMGFGGMGLMLRSSRRTAITA